MIKLVSYPARPLNGGRLGLVTKKPIYLWSSKLNGWRAVIHTPTRTMFNRQGQEITIASEFHEALEDLSRSGFEWIDAEALERRHHIGRGSLIILDAIIPEAPHLDAHDRFSQLIRAADRLAWPVLGLGQRPDKSRVYLLHQSALSDASPTGKSALTQWWAQMQAFNQQWGADFYEGLVAKRADSPYPIQLRSPDAESPFWVKHRWAW
jgi:hypothetical protein